MNLAQIGNLLEAILWIGIGTTLLIRSLGHTPHAILLRILAASFVVFGLTDLIEIQSGAWWRPRWLLAVKAACVVSFALCLRRYLQTRLPSSPPPS